MGIVGALALWPVLAGCSMLPQLACPAIGWLTTVTVALEGSVQDVETVELCVERTCSVMADQSQQVDKPLVVVTAIPQETKAPTAQPATPPFATKMDDHTWTFNLMMGAPKEVTVRALTADGTVVAERAVSLSWKRVGGTERCGGPVETAPLLLSIPD
jgi:hypothetical protein